MKRLFTLLLSAICVLALEAPAFSATRVKDIGHIAGVRSNALTGVGLVIGLNKTGDKKQTLAIQAFLNMLEKRFGLRMDPNQVKVENIAMVMVTGNIPAFARPGSQIDVTVSSIADATSLQGGVLLQTPLMGPDDNVYAVAQGALTLGGFTAGGETNGVTVNHPTVGRIPNGGMVERSVSVGLPQAVDTMDFVLDRQDFTNVKRVVDALNKAFGRTIASPLDGRSVRLDLPTDYRERPVEFIAAVEAVTVEVDTKARVIVNERTGTVVIGSDVKISPVMIAHGSLSIQIQTTPTVSQPDPFSLGQTVVAPEVSVTVVDQKSPFVAIPQNATVDDLVHALNSMGVTPRDTVAILEALKVAGALQAELEIL